MPEVTQQVSSHSESRLLCSGPPTGRACPVDSLLSEQPDDILPRTRKEEGEAGS